MRFVLLALAGLILSLKLWSNVMLTQQVFGDRNDDPPPECLLVFPHNDLTRVLLQQPNGSVNLDAKEFKIAMRPGFSPVVTCSLYRGVYRPSTPVTKVWTVKEIKFVEQDVFQKLVDEAIGSQDDTPTEDAKEGLPGASTKSKIGVPSPPSIPLNPNSAKSG